MVGKGVKVLGHTFQPVSQGENGFQGDIFKVGFFVAEQRFQVPVCLLDAARLIDHKNAVSTLPDEGVKMAFADHHGLVAGMRVIAVAAHHNGVSLFHDGFQLSIYSLLLQRD